MLDEGMIPGLGGGTEGMLAARGPGVACLLSLACHPLSLCLLIAAFQVVSWTLLHHLVPLMPVGWLCLELCWVLPC